MKQDTLEGRAKTKNGVIRLCFSVLCILLEAAFIIIVITRTMDVQLDKEKHMENAKTKEQTEPERAEAERVEAEIVYAPMVAEPQEYQYNADAFEARGVDEVKQEAAHKEVSKVRADKAR